MSNLKEALARMLRSLDGLSVGDAFGELFFMEPREAVEHILARRTPDKPWRWTDDTEMSLSVVSELEPDVFLAQVAELTPPTLTRDGIEEARRMSDLSALHVAERLGSGSAISAQDTVPFCLWVACRYPTDYEEALWQTVLALGDRDTTCAIVGGILAAGGAAIPEPWLTTREALPDFRT